MFTTVPSREPLLVSPLGSNLSHFGKLTLFLYAAVYEVGAFFGAVLSFFIGDRLGRLNMMWIGAVWMIVGTVIAVTAFGPHWGFGQFIISRVVSGVGTGMLTATIPSWVAECSKSHNRGFLICMEASTVAVGTVIAYWVDYGCAQVDSSFSWRFPIALQSVFAFVVIWGALTMPQSPRWLVAHGQDEQALRVIAALNGTTMDHPAALEQRRIILESVNATLMSKASAKDLLQSGKKQNLRRMIIGASSQVHQQLGGCNAVIYYATILFENQM
jgi:MFS family permease